jgi:hypothetical protein
VPALKCDCRRVRCTRSGWPRPTAKAQCAFDRLVASFKAKDVKATDCLLKHRESLARLLRLSCRAVGAYSHHQCDSVGFATIRHRSNRATAVSRDSILSILFKLGTRAQDSWRRLGGFEALAKVLAGVRFRDGVEEPAIGRKSAVSQARARTEQSRRQTPRHTPDLTIPPPLGRSGSSKTLVVWPHFLSLSPNNSAP